MSFLHKHEHLRRGDIVVANCSHRCNVMLLDDTNFRFYQSRGRFTYYGGYYTHFPVHIRVPEDGEWNVVLDLGGGSASINYSFDVIRAAA